MSSPHRVHWRRLARRFVVIATCAVAVALWGACRHVEEVHAEPVPVPRVPPTDIVELRDTALPASIEPAVVTAQAEPDAQPTRMPPSTCTYSTYDWSVEKKTGVNHRNVSKGYAEVTDDERDPSDPRCTVCSEDQVEIRPAEHGLDGVEPFQVCYAYQSDVVAALEAVAADDGFSIHEVVGYRCGRTRGKVVDGVRTEWSNHSFGTAVDINADHNGLYGNCDVPEVTSDAIKACKLRVGGKWDPTKRPRTTIVKSGIAYRAFTRFWKWGGEIEGGTRDMMHFSNTGY